MHGMFVQLSDIHFSKTLLALPSAHLAAVLMEVIKSIHHLISKVKALKSKATQCYMCLYVCPTV